MKKLLLFLLISLNGYSQTKISYKKSDGLLDVTPYISYMADSTEKLTFEQVRRLPASAFKVNGKVGLNFGSTNYPYWFKLDFENLNISEDIFLTIGLNARTINFYTISKNDSVEIVKSGFLRAFGNNYFRTNRNIFKVNNPKTIYFRLESDSMHAEVFIGTIQPLYNKNHQLDLIIGGIIAIIFAIALYNLFLFFSLKDKLFLYYSIMTFYTGYINIRWSGLQHELYNTTNPLFVPDNMTQVYISNILGVIFVSKFLNLRQIAPKFFWWLIFLIAINTLIVPFDWISNNSLAHIISYNLLIVQCFSALIIGIYFWYKGFEPAKYYTIAWIVFLSSIIILYLGLLGIVSLNNLWVRNAWQIGSVIEVLLTSFAVAYRFNLFRQEARDAQALVLQRSGENEQLLLAHNQILEEKLQLEAKMDSQKADNKVNELLKKLQSERGKNKKLAVSTIEGVLLLPIPDIIRLEALGSYCNIHLTNNKKIIASKNLAEFEPMLDKSDFLRIHKSHIVNINFVERYIRGEGGIVIMQDGAEVSVSRTMKTELLQRLNIS